MISLIVILLKNKLNEFDRKSKKWVKYISITTYRLKMV